jgi:peptide/nickel transport system permease protein
LYPLYGPKDFNKVMFLYNKKGDLIGVPPIPPSSHYWLGSDRNGADRTFQVFMGRISMEEVRGLDVPTSNSKE